MAPRSVSFDRVVRTIIQGAEQTVQRALVDRVKRELGRVEAEARPDSHERWIDRHRGAPIEAISPYGVAYFEFSYIPTIIGFAASLLRESSPVDFVNPDDKVYRDSHAVFVHGDQAGILREGADLSFLTKFDQSEEFIVTDLQPYARRIEIPRRNGQPFSKQAPKGVYQICTSAVARRFARTVSARFVWVKFSGQEGTEAYPAMSIQAR
ncbi:hypothetical protein [Azospirillum rugosum]|uniref:Uncharacterized protein n=1 Tax=Azospirillum rugosum TaxID=416170 RepID=A0ABS4SEN6_9PROT|nr:hypothetical protein [Azospirillum rugosum]MBP2291047.1 hypothetical protein [Azospirillum rugosum]MDQ0524889.1 hypothetical protein [Azospirillum rugosum]